jgi:hypothetical protein
MNDFFTFFYVEHYTETNFVHAGPTGGMYIA